MKNLFQFAPGVRKRLAVGLALALVVLLLDQVSKVMILRHFESGAEGRVTVLPVLDFVLTWNRGVSFSLAANLGDANRVIFGVLAVAVSAALILWMARGARRPALIGLGMVVGGALGNALDRIRFGAVEDFLYLHVGAFDWWPVFNVGDSAICVGAGFLILDSLLDR